MSERWLVTGARGMLGRDLVGVLRDAGRQVTAAGRSDLDITDPDAVRNAVRGHDVVVNAAAWTDVDGAESAEDRAHQVNAAGPGRLARACAETGARLVQISTDYVFSGDAGAPYDESAAPSPLNVYGRTKRDGEIAVLQELPAAALVVRTSWLYGAHGRSFVTTIARLAAERDHLDVVDDQHGQPTWTLDLASRVVDLADADAPVGVYHASNAGCVSWYDLARAVFEELGLDPARVRPVTSEAFPRPAPRPAYSVLGAHASARAGLPPMRSWREALADAAPSLLHQPARLA